MNVAIELPEDIALHLAQNWGNLSQRTLEAVAIEAYRAGVLTEAQVQEMLCLSSRWEVDRVLKQAHAYLDYTEEDLAGDIEALRAATHP